MQTTKDINVNVINKKPERTWHVGDMFVRHDRLYCIIQQEDGFYCILDMEDWTIDSKSVQHIADLMADFHLPTEDLPVDHITIDVQVLEQVYSF